MNDENMNDGKINEGGLSWTVKVVISAILILILFVVLLNYQIAHGRAVCRRPSVPIGRLELGFDRDFGFDYRDRCATLASTNLFHGVWIDDGQGGWFYPDATTAPKGDPGKTDAWLVVDHATRAAVNQMLAPIGEEDKLRKQLVAISFDGSEYRTTHPNKQGFSRFFDVHEVHAVHMLRRDYLGTKTGK